MSAAEAEIAALAESFNLNVTTDFGQIEQVIQAKIDKNRGKARVAADLSTEGVQTSKPKNRCRRRWLKTRFRSSKWNSAYDRRKQPQVPTAEKDLGPAVTDKVLHRD